jgi:hypothetical protein
LFSAIPCHLVDNTIKLIMQLYIIENGPRSRNPWNEEFPFLAAVSTDDPVTNPLLNIYHNFIEYIYMLSAEEIVFGKGHNISGIPILQLLSQPSFTNILGTSQLSFTETVLCFKMQNWMTNIS